MAKQVNQNRCIQCNAPLPDSPSEGITVVNTVFVIDPRLCAECAGMYARSLCSTTHPSDTAEPARREEPSALLRRAAARRR